MHDLVLFVLLHLDNELYKTSTCRGYTNILKTVVGFKDARLASLKDDSSHLCFWSVWDLSLSSILH
jgi:hypothetical protein